MTINKEKGWHRYVYYRNKKPTCCFCGKECEDEFGNNPYPVETYEKARCCNLCNKSMVVPARIKAMLANTRTKKKGE